MTNREIDVLVAEKVMGWEYLQDSDKWFDGEFSDLHVIEWGPSSNISDAWQVVEKFERYAVRKVTGGHKAAVLNPTDGGWDDAVADTAPMAICLAALKAKGVDIS